MQESRFQRLSVFPLELVVCPQGRLPLKIFEPRYLDMVKRSLRDDEPFVIVMRRGDQPGEVYELGTTVKIVDFDQTSQGLLSIMIQGLESVEISGMSQEPDGLWVANVEVIEPEAFVELPDQLHDLVSVLQALTNHEAVAELGLEIDFNDCRHVGWRLIELLPFESEAKQELYETRDPLQRAERILDMIDLIT